MVSVSPEMLCFAGTFSFDLVNVIVQSAASAVAARSNSVADVSLPLVGTATKCHVPATSAAASAGAGAGAGAAAGVIAAAVSFGASFLAQAATTSAVQQRTKRDARYMSEPRRTVGRQCGSSRGEGR